MRPKALPWTFKATPRARLVESHPRQSAAGHGRWNWGNDSYIPMFRRDMMISRWCMVLGCRPVFRPTHVVRGEKNWMFKTVFYIPYSAHFHMIFPVSFWSIFSPGGVLLIGLPGGPTAGAIMWRVAPRGLGEDPKTAGLTMKNWDVTSWSVEFTFVPKKRSEPTESTENGEFTKWNCKFGQEICRCCNWEDLGIDPTRWNKPGKTCINVSIDIHCQRMWEIEWAIRKVKTYHGHVQKLIDSSHLWGKCHTKSPCSPC